MHITVGLHQFSFDVLPVHGNRFCARQIRIVHSSGKTSKTQKLIQAAHIVQSVHEMHKGYWMEQMSCYPTDVVVMVVAGSGLRGGGVRGMPGGSGGSGSGCSSGGE